MKRRCLLLLATFLLTGCSSNIKQEVELFNQNTEVTINRYEDVKSAREDKTEALILAIANKQDLNLTLSDSAKTSINEARALLTSSEHGIIEAMPYIKSDNFYTRLGHQFVTQIVTFGYQGKVYLLEILWTSGTTIDSLYLEVLD